MLGLSGMQAPPNHAMLRTPALPGIDEIKLTLITLDDPDTAIPMEETVDTSLPNAKDPTSSEPVLSLSDLTTFELPPQTLEEIIGLTHEIHVTPSCTPQTHVHVHTQERMARMQQQQQQHALVLHNRSISVPPRSTARTTTLR